MPPARFPPAREATPAATSSRPVRAGVRLALAARGADEAFQEVVWILSKANRITPAWARGHGRCDGCSDDGSGPSQL